MPASSDTPDPLIVTARFDPLAAATFQRLRDQHFPPRLNIVPAHCTLFHHLPGARSEMVRSALAEACASRQPLPFETTGLRFLGRGVALEILSPALVALRASLAAIWREVLTPQDRQGFKPHVTVQNKVDPARARALRDDLAAGWTPLDGRIEGLDLWHYRGGPWERAQPFAFADAPAP